MKAIDNDGIESPNIIRKPNKVGMILNVDMKTNVSRILRSSGMTKLINSDLEDPFDI